MSTRAERRMALPGDEVVEHPQVQRTHAATLDASPAVVWPWLVQMGWHRGGWYTAGWVDRLLFPANAPSVDRIVPELQGLAVGDWIPDGPPESGCGFDVVALRPERHLVLRSTTHVPPAWRRSGRVTLLWSWAFVLAPADDGRRTRLRFRVRGRLSPGWARLAYRLVVVPADAYMSRSFLRGLAVHTGNRKTAGLRS